MGLAMSQVQPAAKSQHNPRPDLISREFIAVLKRAGIVEAYLFGSVARNEDMPDSDIDVLAKFDRHIKLIEQLDLMVKLSRLTGRDVELVTDLDPILEPYIMPTLVPIPL